MPPNRIDRRIMLLLFALSLGLYLRTMAPGLLAGDPGEFQVAAWTLGLAHATGYPLYLLLGSLWQHTLAIVGVSPATALNVLSALFGATTVMFLYPLMLNWLTGPQNLSRIAAAFTATLFAVNPTFWNHSLIAEVYTLHTLFVVLILLAAQRLDSRVLDNGYLRTETTSSTHEPSISNTQYLILAFLIGLSLTHHATTILFLPGLGVYLWLLNRQKSQASAISWHTWLGMGLAMTLPLALYLYIPWRSGPMASPWYHQPLGEGTLTLYQNDWSSFVDFITGRSISVGFYGIGQAMAQLPAAANLWLLHFSWPGLLLIGVGLFILIRQRNGPVLSLTLIYALIHQLFNLFYGIGDIFVYYIPLYLIAAIWAGFAAAGLPTLMPTSSASRQSPTPRLFIPILLFFLPIYLASTYYDQVDQSQTTSTRLIWERILAAEPPDNAILVSNDRNEIVPLFYLQHVERRVQNMTGLFPLIKPGDRFANVGNTIETALNEGGEQPVYLIKEMSGIETKFVVEPANPPLMQILGIHGETVPARLVKQSFGPLTLWGYDWHAETEQITVDLYWRIDEHLSVDYTSTVQLFDTNQNKIGQDDRPPGGVYYPTSLWKPGDILLDSHTIEVADQNVDSMLISMYTGPEFVQLAPPLQIELTKVD